jgi:hypothetical protein
MVTAPPEAESQSPGLARLPLLLVGSLLICLGLAVYFSGIAFSVVRLSLHLDPRAKEWNEAIVWFSGGPVNAGIDPGSM